MLFLKTSNRTLNFLMCNPSIHAPGPLGFGLVFLAYIHCDACVLVYFTLV